MSTEVLQLSNNDLSIYNHLVDKYVVSESKVSSHQVHSEYDTDIDPELIQLLNKSKDLLGSAVVENPRFMIEIWSYRPDGDYVESPLTMHQDDCGATEFKVETCIFYTKFDKELEGGGLHIRDTGIMNLREGDIVIIGGDVWHTPLDVKGVGVRNCIVVQLESVRNKL